MNDELSMAFRLHDDTVVTVLEHCICGTEESVRETLEAGIRFAHIAGIEVFARVGDGEWQHYENIEFTDFCNALLKRMR